MTDDLILFSMSLARWVAVVLWTCISAAAAKMEMWPEAAFFGVLVVLVIATRHIAHEGLRGWLTKRRS